jgi:phage-related protein
LWNQVLLPAIRSVWEFLSTNVFPLFQALADFLGAVFGLQMRVLAGLWQNIFLPALQTVWSFIQANILPIFQAVGNYIANTLQPIFGSVASFLSSRVVPAFSGISNAVQTVIKWLKDMANALNNLKLPGWLTPGSPTPWENGLRGVVSAMKQLNQQIPDLESNLQLSAAGAPGLAGTSGGSASFGNFYINVDARGATDPKAVGTAVSDSILQTLRAMGGA